MRALCIGGTGVISSAVVKLAAELGWEMIVLNRGNRPIPKGIVSWRADVRQEQEIAGLVEGESFDVVMDFIAFTREDVERDWRIFRGKTKQYIFISSASAYQKPLADYVVNESTPLANPYWQYSRDKIACEEFLMDKYREEGFPATIVRPSHTYCERSVPVGVHGARGSWQVLKRMLEGKEIIIHGDGTSLWTMTFHTDFAKGFVGLMANPHALGHAVQITSDESMTWNQIYTCIAQAMGVPLRAAYVPSALLAASRSYDFTGNLLGDKSNTIVFDNAKLKRLAPGYTATVSMREGITKAVTYVLAHQSEQTEDPEFDAWCDRVIEGMNRVRAII